MKIKGLITYRGWYYYRPPQVDGIRPKRIALRTQDLGEAINLAIELAQQSSAHLDGQRLSGEIERYLADRQGLAGLKRASLDSSRNTLRQFCEAMGNPVVTAITADHIRGWQTALVKRGLTQAGIVSYLRRVQGFFSWAKNGGRISQHPFRGVRIPKVHKTKTTLYCTRELRDRLISTCEREDLRFVLMCGFFLGMRRNEIVQARLEWFTAPGYCEITETPTYLPKVPERRIIHYGSTFAAFLEEYGLRWPYMVRPEVEQGRAIYRWDFRRPFNEHMAAQGASHVTPHVMRSTFATLHLLAGTPLSTVAKLLGDSVDTTQRHYAGYALTDEHIHNLD